MRRAAPTRWLLLMAVAFALAAASIDADSRPKFPHQYECNPRSISKKEIPNFHVVDNDLYRGGEPSCAGLAQLDSLGIRTFIDLGGAGGAFHHCKEASDSRIRVYHVKLSVPDLALFGISDAKLRDIFAIMQNSPKPIFLGCSLGRDRTGLVVALYRLKRDEMTFAEAQEEAIHYGYRLRFIGLRKAFDRYRDPHELKLLPTPARSKPPRESVCRAKSLMSTAEKLESSSETQRDKQ